MPVRNQVQLITYPDSLGGNLNTLYQILEAHFADVFLGGVHILPPFPSSGDRGFAPLTYFEIEPGFGSWDDIRRIGERFPVLLDLMVNHISRHSPYFQDFLQRGPASEYADLFLPLHKIWPSGNPPPEDVKKIFLRRPENPFTSEMSGANHDTVHLWATFGSQDMPEQVDLDVHSPLTRQLFRQIVNHLSRMGVRILRLDAVAYVIKKPGTSCFFVEPDLWDFLDWIRAEASYEGIELLPEVHAHHSYQRKLSEKGYWVYDFALPLLVLHTLLHKSSRALMDHLKTCPRNQFTMLDCHDGIPVQPDLDGLIDIDSAQDVVRQCLERGGNLSRILSDNHKLRPDFNAHQINITYYSALDNDDDAYLAARAIQLFTPGVPQIYYVGLLAGENDHAAAARTGEGRAINRHDYSLHEFERDFQKPIVQRLLNLIRFRNTFPAFDGEFEVVPSPDDQLVLSWHRAPHHCTLRVDLAVPRTEIEYTEDHHNVKLFMP